MELEQRAPNRPNFKLIGILFVVAILAIFAFAYVMLRSDRHLDPRAHTPTGQTSALRVISTRADA